MFALEKDVFAPPASVHEPCSLTSHQPSPAEERGVGEGRGLGYKRGVYSQTDRFRTRPCSPFETRERPLLCCGKPAPFPHSTRRKGRVSTWPLEGILLPVCGLVEPREEPVGRVELGELRAKNRETTGPLVRNALTWQDRGGCASQRGAVRGEESALCMRVCE